MGIVLIIVHGLFLILCIFRKPSLDEEPRVRIPLATRRRMREREDRANSDEETPLVAIDYESENYIRSSKGIAH